PRGLLTPFGDLQQILDETDSIHFSGDGFNDLALLLVFDRTTKSDAAINRDDFDIFRLERKLPVLFDPATDLASDLAVLRTIALLLRSWSLRGILGSVI